MKCQFHRWVQSTEYLQTCRDCGRQRSRISKAKKRQRLSPISQKRANEVNAYARAKKKAPNVCCNCGATTGLIDAHHPHGRAGMYVTVFVKICRSLHDKIHQRSREAKECGWLQPQYDRPDDFSATAPRPWIDPDAKRKALSMGFTCGASAAADSAASSSPDSAPST